jgi:uncharacterized membrane protein (UPF0127 family)
VRARLAIAAAVAIAALAGMVTIVLRSHTSSLGAARLPFASTSRAAAPFGAFDAARVALGSRCLRVLVASTPGQRSQGLREVTSLSPYDAMLFVFPSDSATQFTMAQTPTPLDITFFDAPGAPVDSTRMTPCPEGTDATCPKYSSQHRYRYALERPTGATSGGALGGCSA